MRSNEKKGHSFELQCDSSSAFLAAHHTAETANANFINFCTCFSQASSVSVLYLSKESLTLASLLFPWPGKQHNIDNARSASHLLPKVKVEVSYKTFSQHTKPCHHSYANGKCIILAASLVRTDNGYATKPCQSRDLRNLC
jgi:hypothetical protein